jgi:NDP-sugar pyrophosphorylase family protein
VSYEHNIVVLAAGASSRMKRSALSAGVENALKMREATEKPKCMITVGKPGAPFLDYLLVNIRKAGYREVVLVVADGDSTIRHYYDGNRRFSDLRFTFATQHIPAGRETPPGTADALMQALDARPDWSGGALTVCNSDNLYSVNALELLRTSGHRNCLIDYDRSALRFDDARIAQFSVIRKDASGVLVDILEKPGEAETRASADTSGRIGVSMNIFRFSYSDIYPILLAVVPHPVRGEKELPGAVRMMIQRHPGSVFTVPLAEHVPDLTTVADIGDLEDLV